MPWRNGTVPSSNYTGSIKQRPNGAWRARYRDEDGREHARHFKLKRDAEAWLQEITASMVRGDYRPFPNECG